MARGDAYRYRELLDRGWTREGLRSSLGRGELTRPTRGVYAGAGTDGLRALFRRLPPGTVLGFHSAAAGYGLPVPPDDRVHVIVPPGTDVPLIRGVAAHASVLPVGDPVWLDGVPCVPPERCAVDLARHLRRGDALAMLDATLRASLCMPDQLYAEVARHVGLRGVRQARELVGLADPRAECAQESHLRLVILDARLPPPEPQIWIHDRHGHAVYRIDLGYRGKKVGVEYDGSSHTDATRLQYDRSRHNWLADHGWQIRYVTSRDLYRVPHSIVATLAPLLR